MHIGAKREHPVFNGFDVFRNFKMRQAGTIKEGVMANGADVARLLELYLGQLGAVIKGSPAQRGHRRGYLYTLQATGGKHTAVNSSDTTAEVD